MTNGNFQMNHQRRLRTACFQLIWTKLLWWNVCFVDRDNRCRFPGWASWENTANERFLDKNSHNFHKRICFSFEKEIDRTVGPIVDEAFTNRWSPKISSEKGIYNQFRRITVSNDEWMNAPFRISAFVPQTGEQMPYLHKGLTLYDCR